jgi:hypothetical protein
LADSQSIVPQQALAMTNCRLVLDAAKPIAARISKAVGSNKPDVDDAAVVRGAFMLLLASSPNESELNASREAIHTWRELPKVSFQDARSYRVWALLNHNDFVTLR